MFKKLFLLLMGTFIFAYNNNFFLKEVPVEYYKDTKKIYVFLKNSSIIGPQTNEFNFKITPNVSDEELELIAQTQIYNYCKEQAKINPYFMPEFSSFFKNKDIYINFIFNISYKKSKIYKFSFSQCKKRYLKYKTLNDYISKLNINIPNNFGIEINFLNNKKYDDIFGLNFMQTFTVNKKQTPVSIYEGLNKFIINNNNLYYIDYDIYPRIYNINNNQVRFINILSSNNFNITKNYFISAYNNKICYKKVNTNTGFKCKNFKLDNFNKILMVKKYIIIIMANNKIFVWDTKNDKIKEYFTNADIIYSKSFSIKNFLYLITTNKNIYKFALKNARLSLDKKYKLNNKLFVDNNKYISF